MNFVIPRNSRIPIKKKTRLTTAHDNQVAVSFQFYEGENSIPKNNNFLGEFFIEGISPAPKHVHEFYACFDIDANGILSFSAEDTSTGQKKGIAINSDRRNFGRIEKVE
ncbi:hypothetical protein M0R45_034100 [Rubus argutus]|uniref:Uncharacterized protein n=1 Tax=Rubus argutus TaxID=59490 RepID=A0AAW1VQB7_RUBAR